RQRAAFADAKPATHPHIAAWRQAYESFGAKPKKILCSVEALLSRTLKGNDLPTINYIVDLYNAISIRHVLPVGGEDLDRLESDLVLTFATGSEPFDSVENGEAVIAHPAPGEVVFADSAGVTCRCWNWRQCRRTQLTLDTRNAYFVLDCLAPYTIEELMCAGEELMQYLRDTSPACAVTYELLGQHSS
ncbi:MAG TPA: phenylalanine--tRNA ligase beta subunit-related protein, partial [Ktedonobacteraceae bacterium]|nr:phenylalanine--tRNA ligase beta subunit-related protein [Ktedonobacteraceae bacterium]